VNTLLSSHSVASNAKSTLAISPKISLAEGRVLGSLLRHFLMMSEEAMVSETMPVS